MPNITFGARSFALIATGLALFALFALHEACPGELRAGHERAARAVRAAPTSQQGAGALDPSAAPAPQAALSLLDFPPGADVPAGPYATRPRRPARLATQLRASSAVLLQATGGAGYHPDSPAARGHGVRLHLAIAQGEAELVSLFLRGGDEGGADFIALSLERFVALLPQLAPAMPKVFLLLAHSRGAEVLLSSARFAALGDLRGRRIAYGRSGAGLYFLTWRLLKEGIAPGQVALRAAESPSEALRWLRAGQVEAALVQELDLARGGSAAGDQAAALDGDIDSENAGALLSEGDQRALGGGMADSQDVVALGEGAAAPLRLHRLASTADAPRLVPEVLIGRGDFLVRYPEVARRTARALLAEALNAAEDPLPAARRLLEQVPTLPDPRASIRLAPPASLSENRAFFGLDGSAAPLTYEALFASLKRVLPKQGLAAATGQASDFFWDVPLRKLSARSLSLSSGRMAAQRSEPARAERPASGGQEPAAPAPQAAAEPGAVAEAEEEEDVAASPAPEAPEAQDEDGEGATPTPPPAGPTDGAEPGTPSLPEGDPVTSP